MESVRELIERRAFELFVQRDGQHGYHIQDWLQAEKDVLTQPEKPKVAKTVVKPLPPPAAPAAAEELKPVKKAPAKKRVTKKKSA